MCVGVRVWCATPCLLLQDLFVQRHWYSLVGHCKALAHDEHACLERRTFKSQWFITITPEDNSFACLLLQLAPAVKHSEDVESACCTQTHQSRGAASYEGLPIAGILPRQGFTTVYCPPVHAQYIYHYMKFTPLRLMQTTHSSVEADSHGWSQPLMSSTVSYTSRCG